MIKALYTRLKFGNRTIGFPNDTPILPERFRGRPEIGAELCQEGCKECLEACPTSAIKIVDRHPQIDLGRCLFCRECEIACPEKAIKFTSDFSLAANKRTDLVVS
ncbi:MAG TPA: 4Fe-4S binding protein, partial [candidate division Zixibacteria bacterium]|nr:4Fe-4S binding protein [candidate division Zixibacteria bacterium]